MGESGWERDARQTGEVHLSVDACGRVAAFLMCLHRDSMVLREFVDAMPPDALLDLAEYIRGRTISGEYYTWRPPLDMGQTPGESHQP